MQYIDMHCDTISALFQSPESGHLSGNQLCIDKVKLQKGQALMQFFACFADMKEHGSDVSGRNDEWQVRADASYEYVLKLLDFFEQENKEAQLKICLSQGNVQDLSALLTVEEGGVLNNDPDRLMELYRKGVRLVTLTWNYENCLGFPNSQDPYLMKLGLKPFGKEIVQKMNEQGMIVDVSHLSDGGFYDVADICKSDGKPFVASHSCARALCPHPRNLTDEMLKVLGNQGGVVGVNFYGRFLNEEPCSDIESMVRHIRHMVNKAGIESVGFGSDFDGFDGGSEVADASMMPMLIDALAKAGFTYDQIEKIAWRNSLRVVRDVLKNA